MQLTTFGATPALSQALTLTVGATYTLTYLEDSRSGYPTPIVQATIGGVTVVANHALVSTSGAFTRQTVTFVATAASEVLSLVTTSHVSGALDATALYTNVSVTQNGSWGFTPILADGAYTLTAAETDTAGNTTSATLALTLNTDVVTGITVSPATGPVGSGKTITVTLTTSVANTVTGAPTVLLSNGAVATYNAGASSGASLVFSTTVAAGQDTADLLVSSLSLNGGTIARWPVSALGRRPRMRPGTVHIR